MPPDMAKHVEETSAAVGISQSEFVRRVIDQIIAKHASERDEGNEFETGPDC